MNKALLVLVAAVVVRAIVAFYSPGSLEAAQCVVFLLAVAYLLWRGSFVLPRVAVTLALVGGVVGASYGYSVLQMSHAHGVVYVMRLSGDATGGESRILREAIAGPESSLTRGFYREIDPKNDLRGQLAKLFDQTQGESGIVWGSTRFVRYSPAPKVAVKIKSFVEYQRSKRYIVSPRLGELLLVTDVPVIGMSFEPIGATGNFLRLLTKAGRATGELRQQLLESAGRIQDRWRASEHKAYPFFLVGTGLISDYIENGGQEKALLECSVRDFQSALTLLKTGGTPQLLAAVRNNLAISQALLLESNGEPIRSVRKGFELANRLGARHDPFRLGGEAPRVAADNLHTLFGAKQRSGVNSKVKRKNRKPKGQKAKD